MYKQLPSSEYSSKDEDASPVMHTCALGSLSKHKEIKY